MHVHNRSLCALSPCIGATNSFSSGLHLIKSAFRPSDPGEVFSPRAVRINMDGGLDFTPITLVFQELRCVPRARCLSDCVNCYSVS